MTLVKYKIDDNASKRSFVKTQTVEKSASQIIRQSGAHTNINSEHQLIGDKKMNCAV